MKKRMKGVALALLTGGLVLQFGCLGQWFNLALSNLPGSIFAEWLLDNDAIFDLFEDGGTAA